MESNSSQTLGLYQPLDASRAEIRLLVLSHPQGGGETLQLSGTLRTVSLDDSPTYSALSYVWGVPEPPGSIRVDGAELKITPNLATSLRTLMSHDDALGPIWIDALCINQGDFEERASQVSLMGRVFHQATNTLLWLGEGDDLSDWTIDRMNDADFGSSLRAVGEIPRVLTLEEAVFDLVVVCDLEQREYWSRAWILQEFVLPEKDPTIICGHRRVQLSRYEEYCRITITRLLYHGQTSGLVIDVPFSKEDVRGFRSSRQHRDWRNLYWKCGRQESFLSLLVHYASSLGVTDPRDHVYSVLGMAGAEENRLIHVDYRKPPEEVFQDAFTIIWTTKDEQWLLGISIPEFSFHRPTESTLGKMPSWVPDLTNQSAPYSAPKGSGDKARSWRGPSAAERYIQDDILYLKAFEFDVVSKVECCDFDSIDAFLNDADGEVDVGLLDKLESIVERAKQTAIPGSDPLYPFDHLRCDVAVWEAFAYWSAGAWAALNDPNYPLPVVDTWDRDFLWEILMRRKEIPEPWRSSCPESLRSTESTLRAAVLRPMLSAMSKICFRKKILVSEHGFVGTGSLNIEKGDVLILVVGMRSPYVLRPYQDGYHLIGFAWIPRVSELTDWTAVDECLLKSGLEEKFLKIY